MLRGLLYMAASAAVIILFAMFVGVTDESDALRILGSDGITKVQFTGYRWFGCSDDDWYHTGFRGFRNGQTVNGVVCSGLFLKGSTIRYF